MKQRIFSGVQPSGNLHLGNYLGAIKNWVQLQDQYDSIFCVVDLHAITVPQDPQILRQKTLEIAKIYLAAGISAKGGSASGGESTFPIIFVQSHVPAHSELAWILNTVTKISELDKMTQFKDKVQKTGRESAALGLYAYPVLMAADILLYGTQVVPVGEDQKQHVELARDLAKRFNHQFGETFVVPEAHVRKEGMRVMGLDDPTKKMSKSAASAYNYIALTDDAETVRKKIKKAVTDSGSEIAYQDDKPALKNLINIYAALTEQAPTQIVEKFQGRGYGEFKQELAEVIIGFLESFQQRLAALSDEQVMQILQQGAAQARLLAQKKLREIKQKVGFLQ